MDAGICFAGSRHWILAYVIYFCVVIMDKQQAINLLQEALNRLENPSGNANGGDIQLGGVYWRLAKVLNDYVDVNMGEQEGCKHAKFIRYSYGAIVSNG